MSIPTPAQRVAFVRDRLPPTGLFAGQTWRLSPDPFPLAPALVQDLTRLGRTLLQFYRALNRLYRLSAEGKQPAWVAQLLDQGKPPELVELQRDHAFKNEVPRVLRPDILLTETGWSITELDSVPGGIGLTAWLNRTYSQLAAQTNSPPVLGGADDMLRGFASIFGQAPRVHLVVSEESATYRPEMEWLAQELGSDRFQVRDTSFTGFDDGDAIYRFFELFDLPNIPNAADIFARAQADRLQLTPPPKPIFEEKLILALLWNRHLQDFWHRELGQGFHRRLLQSVPYSWVIDPTPLPPHAAFPELGLIDWQQLKTLSQRERELILKVSGFSDKAWGARGVYLGSDLSHEDWSRAVDLALTNWPHSPFVLQRYHRPRLVESRYVDHATQEIVLMPARVRLCPYYFVHGDGDAARAQLGGVLATLCPADKKILHGMKDAILAPCAPAGAS